MNVFMFKVYHKW